MTKYGLEDRSAEPDAPGLPAVRFAPHTEGEVAEMLDAIGLRSLDELFEQIPGSVRLDGPLAIPDGVSELEIVDELRVSPRATGTSTISSASPAPARTTITSPRSSGPWRDAPSSRRRTPRTSRSSPRVLQALFEFQSICELTAMEVSNASLYDGATALVEAVNMARVGGRTGPRLRGRRPAGGDAPHVRDRARVRARGVPRRRGTRWRARCRGGRGGGDRAASQRPRDPRAGGRPLRAQAGGAKAIQVFDPLSLGVLAPPGELGADIAVAEGQSLGNHLAFGGPYLGLITARMSDVRRMPGRIVGETVDADGQPGYVLTLQAREQHIRREKANSNICTNQTLMAVAATIYLGWLGPEGLVEIGRRCAAKASYAAERLTRIPGVSLLHPSAPFFKEFAIRVPGPAAALVEDLVERGYLAGVPLASAGGDVLLVAVTERRSKEQIDGLAAAMGESLA